MGLAVHGLPDPSFPGGPLAGWRAEHPRITAFGRTWPCEHFQEYLDTLHDPPQICSHGAFQHSQQEREPAVLASPAAALGRAVRGSPAGWLACQRSHRSASLGLIAKHSHVPGGQQNNSRLFKLWPARVLPEAHTYTASSGGGVLQPSLTQA